MKLTSMVYELIDQGLLARSAGDRPVLTLNDASWEVLRGKRQVQLPRRRPGPDPHRGDRGIPAQPG